MPSICFPRHVGLPGEPDPPTIDGFVEPEEFIEAIGGFGTVRSEVDTGWTQSSRITYVADVAVGAGRPLMVFQGLKHRTEDHIYLSFVVRRDTAFDDQDRIVLVFRPSFATGSSSQTGAERRIDILPNSTGVGAGTPDGSGSTLRENRDPRNVEFYRWDTTGAGSWTSIAAINNVAIKVRSWDLGINNKNWSVEVRLPTTTALGGTDWIDLSSSFGFYFNVIRLCSGSECSFDPTPFDGGSFQFTWPRADYTTGDRLITGELDVNQAEIPPAWLGEAFLGNVPGCSGVTGVKFQNGAGSIGVLSGSSISNQISANDPNQFVARLINTASTQADAVEATFRIANWGTGPGDNNLWNLVQPTSGGTSNPSAPQSIPAGGTPVDLITEWTLTPAQKAQYGTTLDDHQCIWVLLDSVQSVDFVESSIRRNMNFQGLSTHEQASEISGEGYPDPPEGVSDQDFALIVSQMRRGRLVKKDEAKDKPQRDFDRFRTDRAFSGGNVLAEPSGLIGRLLAMIQNFLGNYTVIYDWVWVMDGYRKTEFETRTGGKRHRVYQASGSFGYLAEHEGLVQSWEQSVGPTNEDAARFERTGTDAYRLRVPNGGSARIMTRLAAKEFHVPWWIWLLIVLIIALLIRLLS